MTFMKRLSCAIVDARVEAQAEGKTIDELLRRTSRGTPACLRRRHLGPPGRLRFDEEASMPQKKHLASVSDKEQRMYEHIKESELQQGRPTKRAKAIAAATVVKHHNAKRQAKTK